MEIILNSRVFVYSGAEVDMEDGAGETIEEFYNETMKNDGIPGDWYNFVKEIV